jgi:hypothetical protein
MGPKPDVEYWALPQHEGVPFKEEAALRHNKPFKDDSRKASVLKPTEPRKGVAVGDNVVLPKHYSRFQIEPIRFIGDNNLNFFQGNIVKYTLRYDAKNGIEDIRKVQRYARMFELWLMGHPDWAGPDPRDKELTDKFEAIFNGFRELVDQHVKDPKERAEVLKGIIHLEASHANSRPS